MQRRVFDVRYLERQVRDFRLILDLDDAGISKELFLSDSREEEHIYMLERYLRPGMRVLDCGANIGYYSVMMGRLVGPSGMVYAAEPVPSNFDLLKVNLRLNGLDDHVETFNLGFSNVTGTEQMYMSVMSNRHTFHPVEYVGPSRQTLRDGKPVDIPVTTIGDFAREGRQFDLIRMDIEGYEVEVFQGLIPALADLPFKPAILFETHRPRYDAEKHDMRRPLEGLFGAGYRVKWLASDGHDSRGGSQAYAERGYGPANIEAVFKSSDRALYNGISNEHAIDLICSTDWVRAAFLEGPAPNGIDDHNAHERNNA
ncbi:MAG: FkbM family methyltransferase [Dehalococcoidia bacterium]